MVVTFVLRHSEKERLKWNVLKNVFKQSHLNFTTDKSKLFSF